MTSNVHAADSTSADSEAVALDEQIRRQEDAIEKEVADKQALVGPAESLSSLEDDYRAVECAQFLKKIKELQQTFSRVRRIRGDGNCFYRALIYAQCERMLTDKAECDRFIAICKLWYPRLIKLGFPDFTTQDFCDTFTDFLERIKADMKLEDLLAEFNCGETSNYYVVFLRLAASGHLKENADFYMNFIDSNRTVEQYCGQEVEPMFRVADHLTILAVTKALEVSLRIHYVDQSEALMGGQFHDFIAEGLPSQGPHIIHLLYRHDHYDILYLK